MRRRDALKAMALWFPLSSISLPVRAELGVAQGKIGELTKIASAQLNDALSLFHQMMAMIDLRKVDDGQKLRDDTVRRVRASSESFLKAVYSADEHILEVKPISNDELADVTLFNNRAGDHHIELPTTQKKLIKAIAQMLTDFAERLEKADVKTLSFNLRAQQALLGYTVDLEKFLSAATTILTLG